MSMSGSKIREQVAHFLVDIHIQGNKILLFDSGCLLIDHVRTPSQNAKRRSTQAACLY